MLYNCKVSVIEMPSESLSDAFQLFDSQNNRGKALEPHDLLKAYHLRAIDNPSESTVESWERFVDDNELNLRDLFDKHFLTEHITLADLSEVAFFSPWYSARILNELTGVAPADYIRRLKLSKSAHSFENSPAILKNML